MGVTGTGSEFAASRWTRGNRLFRTRIVVTPERVLLIKRRLFGSDEESIAISKVASVKIHKGVIWSDICIESSGGTDPIQSHGHSNTEAAQIRDLIEQYQGKSERAGNV